MPQRDGPVPPPQQIIDEQRREIERLREDLRRSEAERQRLRRENEKLKEELEAARRAVYRQAAPFSRGTRVAHPRRPGRKPGAAYGRRAHRAAPCARRRHLRGAVACRPARTVRGRCGPRAWRPNFKRSCRSSGRSSAASTWRLATVCSAAGACRGAIRCKHRRRSVPPPCSSARRPPPSPSCSINATGWPTARSRGCSASASGSRSRAAAWCTPSSGPRGRRSPPMPRCGRPSAGVRWSRSMKPAGASTRCCSGSGSGPRPTRRSMRFCPAAAWRKPPV